MKIFIEDKAVAYLKKEGVNEITITAMACYS